MTRLTDGIYCLLNGVGVIMRLDMTSFSNLWHITPKDPASAGEAFRKAVEPLFTPFPSKRNRLEDAYALLDMDIGYINQCHIIRKGIERVKDSWDGESLEGLLQPTSSLLAYFFRTLHEWFDVRHFRRLDGRKIQWRPFDDQTFLKCDPAYRCQWEQPIWHNHAMWEHKRFKDDLEEADDEVCWAPRECDCIRCCDDLFGNDDDGYDLIYYDLDDPTGFFDEEDLVGEEYSL